MPTPADYSYNPNLFPYHAQAGYEVPMYPQAVAPQVYDQQPPPQPWQFAPHESQSSSGSSSRRRSETGTNAHQTASPRRPEAGTHAHQTASPRRPESGTHVASPYARVRAPTTTSRRRASQVQIEDSFPPGCIFSFPRGGASPDAQWILANPGRQFHPPPPLQLEYLPRRPEHCGPSSEQPIKFFSRNLPGVLFADNLPRVLDDPHTTVVPTRSLRWIFDYPGYPVSGHRIHTSDGITRLKVAEEIFYGIMNIIGMANCKHLRLVALVYHGTASQAAWTPVLAVEHLPSHY